MSTHTKDTADQSKIEFARANDSPEDPRHHASAVVGSSDIRNSEQFEDNYKSSESKEEKLLLVFSSHNALTLQANVAALRAWALGSDIADLAYTLGERRSRHSERTFVVTDKSNVIEALTPDALITHHVRWPEPAKVAFVFTGQSQSLVYPILTD